MSFLLDREPYKFFAGLTDAFRKRLDGHPTVKPHSILCSVDGSRKRSIFSPWSKKSKRTRPVLTWTKRGLASEGRIALAHRNLFRSSQSAEVLREIPELQTPKKTSLDPIKIFRCLRLKVWDAESQRMISGSASQGLTSGLRDLAKTSRPRIRVEIGGSDSSDLLKAF